MFPIFLLMPVCVQKDCLVCPSLTSCGCSLLANVLRLLMAFTSRSAVVEVILKTVQSSTVFVMLQVELEDWRSNLSRLLYGCS